MPATDEKQNITLRLSRETIQKARVLAARRATSISGLLTRQLEELANARRAEVDGEGLPFRRQTQTGPGRAA
jgi:HSP90 family molecular chaperone